MFSGVCAGGQPGDVTRQASLRPLHHDVVAELVLDHDFEHVDRLRLGQPPADHLLEGAQAFELREHRLVSVTQERARIYAERISAAP